MQQHPDRPKLINLLIQFQQKLQSNIKQKKYKQFLKTNLKLQTLANTISKQKPIITKQLICFRLGLQSKIAKCVEISLVFLNRLFEGKFIDLNMPDYTQFYTITKDGITQEKIQPTRMIKQMLVKVLEELIHFKNNTIDSLLINSFQYLIGEEILNPILALSQRQNNNYFNLLCSYFSYRFYFFQDTYIYTETEAAYINDYAPKIQRLHEQIKKGQIKHNALRELTGFYVDQIVCQVTKQGGKYGLCIICHGQCNNFCKQTKASVCTQKCKQQHLRKSYDVDNAHFRSNILFTSIVVSLNQLFSFIKTKPKNLIVFIELIDALLSKPYLFMIVKQQISYIFYNQLPLIIGTLYQQTNQKCQKLLFSIMGSLINIYKGLFLNQIQQFFLNKVLGQLQSKKPKLQSILNIFKFLHIIFKNGQNFIELYLNLDTAINRQNIIQRLMYQLSRVLQDRFASHGYDYSKADKIALKSDCLSIHIDLIKYILDIPYPKDPNAETQTIINEKNKKTNLQKFILKFNQNVTSGIKALFNLSLVTLDNQEEEIFNIFRTTTNINKKSIQKYLFDENNKQLINKYIRQIEFQKKTLLESLLDYYLILPLPEKVIQQENVNNSINVFVKQYQIISRKQGQWSNISKWIQIFKSSETLDLQKFKQIIQKEQFNFDERKTFQIYMKIKGLNKLLTQSYQSRHFYIDNSKKYLQIIQGQINLIQISISHLLQSQYDTFRTLQLIRVLQQLSPTTPNLFTLIIKNTNMQYVLTNELNNQNMMAINYLVQVPQSIPNCVSDWVPILKFYNQVFYFTLGACLTPVTMQNKQKLLNSSINNISINILKISSKISYTNFVQFVNSMFKISLNQIVHQRTFLLEKAFNVINTDVDKFVKCWEFIFPHVKAVTMKPVHKQIVLFCIHSLKQNIVLSKKLSILPHQQTAYYQLFKQFYASSQILPLRMGLLQVICYSVQNCQQINEDSWKIIFYLAFQYIKQNETFHQIVYRIIENIMASNLVLFLNFYKDIFELLKQICNRNSKLSPRVFIDIQILLEYLSKRCNKKPDGQNDVKDSQKCSILLKQLLPETLIWLANKFDSDSFDTCIEVFFNLLRIQIASAEERINQKQIYDKRTNQFLDLAFDQIINKTKSQPTFLVNAESFINESVNVGTKMRFFYILQCLSKTVSANFDDLSFIAMKGIKTFIQTLNPQKYDQWKDLTDVLISIINTSRTKNIKAIQDIKLQIGNLSIIQLIEQQRHLPQFPQIQNNETIMNKLIIQRAVLEMVPNDKQCLSILKDIYKQLRTTNDNVCLRMCLWKSGFGKGSVEVPSLLSLQQIVVSRILSIYSFNTPSDQFYDFASQTFNRYSTVCHELSNIELMLSDTKLTQYQYQMLVLIETDLKKKRHLNEKFVRFLVPKITDQQLKKQIKDKLGRSVVSLLGFLDAKTLLLKMLRKLGF